MSPAWHNSEPPIWVKLEWEDEEGRHTRAGMMTEYTHELSQTDDRFGPPGVAYEAGGAHTFVIDGEEIVLLPEFTVTTNRD